MGKRSGPLPYSYTDQGLESAVFLATWSVYYT